MKNLLFILLIIFATGLTSTVSLAQNNKSNRADECLPKEFGQGKVWSLSMRLATCTKALVLTTVDNSYDIIKKPAQAILAAVLLLSVTLLGVKLAGGMFRPQNIMGEMFMLAIKAAIASFLIANYDEFYEIPFKLLDTLIEVSTRWIDIHFYTELNDVCVEYLGEPSKYDEQPLLKMWWNFDCMGLSSLGYLSEKMMSAAPESPLAFDIMIFSLIRLILFFPVFGILMLIFIVVFIFSIYATLFRGIIVYMRTIIVLSLMVIMFPLFLPFIFFSYTKTYYDQLIEILLETIFQPVVFFTIIGMFMMIIVGNNDNESSITKYYEALKIVQEANYEASEIGSEEQLGTLVEARLTDDSLDKKYGLIASFLGSLLLSSAMMAFSMNSEDIAKTMFTTPSQGLNLVPGWMKNVGEMGLNKLEKYKKLLSSSTRGRYNKQAFDHLRKKTQERIDSINARTDLTPAEKDDKRSETYKEEKKERRRMERSNRHSHPLFAHNLRTEINEWVVKDKDTNKRLKREIKRTKNNSNLTDDQKENRIATLHKKAAEKIKRDTAAVQEQVSEGTYTGEGISKREKFAAVGRRVFYGNKSDVNEKYLRGGD